MTRATLLPSPRIKLLATEVAALNHRLQAADAIIAAVTATGEYTAEHVAESTEYVADCVSSGSLDMTTFSDCDRAVLADCMSGSTYTAALIDEVPATVYRRIVSRLQQTPARLGLENVSFAV